MNGRLHVFRAAFIACAAGLFSFALFTKRQAAARRAALDAVPAAVVGQADPSDPDAVLVTGYCNCRACCGWTRPWFGLGKPVYDYGKMKGERKAVGVTARGTRARHGTVAADPKVFPFGTRLHVPGYGVGTVEDTGGSINGRHIDVWFPTHEAALKWGRRWLKVTKD